MGRHVVVATDVFEIQWNTLLAVFSAELGVDVHKRLK